MSIRVGSDVDAEMREGEGEEGFSREAGVKKD